MFPKILLRALKTKIFEENPPPLKKRGGGGGNNNHGLFWPTNLS